ncbi:glycosyltransferase [Halobacillus yeomjeoni]|uniref:glycosyltransferase family 2 protein n=1 Tax=Halobacillus yeomjeoni TaxID=311194 RepID=UPI001CD311F8|nr:glycosyltransferase [Halobacillus yeomjeoni]MCA0983840.1 glycosyltransferase [Halobacillus yeomjeoni]
MDILFFDIYYLFNLIILYYVLFVDFYYVSLFLLSLKQVKHYMRRTSHKVYKDLNRSHLTPPVSLLIPAYNEEKTIVSNLLSALLVEYPEYEVIVINDGSTDATLEELIESYSLHEVNVPIRYQIPTEEIRGVYRSLQYPQLIVLDKENGGKADALNAGVNASNFPYICSVDADSLLDRDALLKTTQPFIEGEDDIVACGGIIRVANGTTVEDGRVVSVGLPKNPLAIHQVIEYLRSFLMGRLGFSGINSLLIISGAFGIFRKREIIEIGGYDTTTVGEDMEIIIRLQKYLYDKKSKAKVIFLPNPICWTEAPSSLKVLGRQRIRWHQGLFQALWKHKKTMFNPKYKHMGLIAMPYFFLVELIGPTVELVGTILMLVGLYFDIVNVPFAILFILATFVFGMFLSMSAVLLEEMTFRKYTRVRDFFKLMLFSMIESFWYRQLNAIWRTMAFFRIRPNRKARKGAWGGMERKGLSQENT